MGVPRAWRGRIILSPGSVFVQPRRDAALHARRLQPLATATALVVVTCLFAGGPTDGVAATTTWAHQFGGPKIDRAYGVTSTAHAVYVGGLQDAGKSGTVGDATGFVRRYSLGGDLVWNRTISASRDDSVSAIASNVSTIYAAGFVDGKVVGGLSVGGRDAFVRAYAPDGTKRWTTQFGTKQADWVGGLTVTKHAIYVAGSTFGVFPGQINRGNDDAFIARLGLHGRVIWVRQFGSKGFDVAYAAARSGADVLVGGSVGGVYGGALPGQASAGGQDAFVQRYEATGTLDWTHQFGTKKDDSLLGLTHAGIGTCGVGTTLGVFAGRKHRGSADGFATCMTGSGEAMWLRQFGTPARDFANAVVATKSELLVAGSTYGNFSGSSSSGTGDGFVREFDPSGSTLSTDQFGTLTDDPTKQDGVLAISAGRSGRFFGGAFWGSLPGETSAGAEDAFLALLSE